VNRQPNPKTAGTSAKPALFGKVAAARRARSTPLRLDYSKLRKETRELFGVPRDETVEPPCEGADQNVRDRPLRHDSGAALANTDEASTVKKSTSTMPEGSRYQTSTNEAK
jgi:hypothetical protein